MVLIFFKCGISCYFGLQFPFRYFYNHYFLLLKLFFIFILPHNHTHFPFFVDLQWNMLEDSININDFCCNPVVSKKKIVKPQQKLLFWAQFALQRGHHGPCPKWKNIFFGRNNKSKSLAFRNFLFYHNIICFGWVMSLFLFV